MTWIAGVVNLDGKANREGDAGLDSCAPDVDTPLSKSIVKGPHFCVVSFNHLPGRSVGGATIREGSSRDSALSLVFVGRLFYRDDLKARLGIGISSDASDDELVLSAYAKWGDQMIDSLEGNFAFMLWDPSKKRAVCGRDRQGLQSVFLVTSGSTLYFASSMELLFHLTGQRPRVNEDYLLFQLYDLYVPEGETAFQNVQRLTPGAVSVFQSSGLSMTRSPLQPLVLDSAMSDDDWVDLAREVVERSVLERCRGVERVGAYLSGGLDSSLITGIAASHLRGSGKTIVAMNLNGRNSDREAPPDQAAIAAHCRMHPNILPETLTLAEHPGLVSSVGRAAFRVIAGQNVTVPLAHKIMRERLVERGAQIVLCGWGGDQVFSNKSPHALVGALLGNGMFSGWRHLQKQAQFESNLPRRLFRRAVTHAIASWRTRMMGCLGQPDKWLRCDRSAADSFVNKSWFREHHVVARLKADRWNQMQGLHGTMADSLRLFYDTRTRYPVPDESVAQDVEPISLELPLLDTRLVQLCLAMPAEQQVVAGMNRSLARRVGRGFMPESTRLQPRKSRVMPTDQDWDRLFLKDARTFICDLSKSSLCWEVLDRSSLICRMESLISAPQGTDVMSIRRCLRAVGMALWLSDQSF